MARCSAWDAVVPWKWLSWGQPPDLRGERHRHRRPWQRGHHTHAGYQIDATQRLLWIGEHRKIKTLLRFFRWFGPAPEPRPARYVALPESDRQRLAPRCMCSTLPHHDVLQQGDRRGARQRGQNAQGEGLDPMLTKTRWLLLKRPENSRQTGDAGRLLRYNLKSVRSYLLKEEFQFFWQYRSAYWAGKFLDRWCTQRCTRRSSR
ncbi:MAG: transposase [Gammaproteobacteria bacterium]|nr:transposase [Gammaproteobacteria bacterium]